MDELLVAIQNAANTIAAPNWAAIISAIFSFVAIIVAGVVAWKQNKIAENQDKLVERQIGISEQQNRIALFEKQYAVYHELIKIISIGEELDSQQMFTRDDLLDALEASWGIIFTHEQNAHEKSVAIVKKVAEAERIIAQSIFLFPGVSAADVDDLLYDAAGFMGAVFLKESVNLEDILVRKFIDASKSFKEKYFDMIVKELDLTGGV